VGSAYYLLDNDKVNGKKWFQIVFETWFVSVVILCIFKLFKINISSKGDIIKSFFPIIFSNNWYITCYVLFYPIHGFLNKIIRGLDKTTHLRIVIALSIIYLGICFLKLGLLYSSVLIIWITIYFILAYFKNYLKDISKSKKINYIIFLSCLALHILLLLLANTLGLKFSILNDRNLHWCVISNPFTIFMAIALINLISNSTFKNHTINYLSKLSLLIYIIHENLIFRENLRISIAKDIYSKFGPNTVIIKVLLFALSLFLITYSISIIYDKTIRRFVLAIGDFISNIISKIYLKVEKLLMKLN
jgi:hypothetical protein